MAKIGRPRVLDDDKRNQVCGLVASGCGMGHAARHVGCSARTVRREALRNPAFGEKLRRAQLSAQLQPMSALRSAASKDWRAAAWLLERTHPDEFARRDPASLSTDSLSAAVDNLLEAIIEEVDDPAARTRVYRRILAISGHRKIEENDARRTFGNPLRVYKLLQKERTLLNER